MTVTHIRIAVTVIVLACVLGLGAIAVKAHEQHLYDPDCCGNGDCEPVSNITFVASDPTALPVMVVTTSHGTKPLTNQTKIRESKDSRMHACIYDGRLLCIYMPPGN